MISEISILILVVLSLYVYFTKKDIFSPAILYTYVWVSVIGISALYLSGLQQEWDLRFILILIFSTVSFIIGTKCIRKSNISSSKLTSKLKIDLESFKNRYSEKKMFKVLIALFILALLSYVATILVLGPPPIFSSALVKRNEYYVSGVELIFLNLIVFMNLSYIYIIVYDKNKFILFLLNIMSFLMLLSKTNKYQLFIIMFLYIITYNLFKNRIGLKKVLITVLLGLTVFVSLYKYVYNDSIISLETRVQINEFKLNDNLSFLVDPYLYVSMNLENLKNFTEQNIQHTYGLQTFSGPLSMFKLNKVLVNGYGINDEWTNNLQYHWLNTGSYLYFFFWDFGLLGLMIGPFFLGLISQYYYNKALSSKANLFNVFMYEYLIFSIILSFFTLIFVQLPIIINLVSIYFIERYSRKRTERVCKEELINAAV